MLLAQSGRGVFHRWSSIYCFTSNVFGTNLNVSYRKHLTGAGNAVGTILMGSYTSPNYRSMDRCLAAMCEHLDARLRSHVDTAHLPEDPVFVAAVQAGLPYAWIKADTLIKAGKLISDCELGISVCYSENNSTGPEAKYSSVLHAEIYVL